MNYYERDRFDLSLLPPRHASPCLFFFFNDTATTEIYTLSLHDALPISPASASPASVTTLRVRYAETDQMRSEEHMSELQSHSDLVCRLLLETKKKTARNRHSRQKRKTKPQNKPPSPKQ